MSNVYQMHQPEIEPGTFEEFWRACPKRVGRPIAEAKWKAITTTGLRTKTLDKDSGCYFDLELKATPQELLDGMRRYAKSQINPMTYKLKDDGKYTLHPSTWLNRGGWMDD